MINYIEDMNIANFKFALNETVSFKEITSID